MNTNYHFLDTNVVLARILNKDGSHEDAKHYFKFTSNRYISDSAKKEAEFKIDNDKRIFLDLIDFIENYAIKNNVNYSKVDKIFLNVEESFLKQYEDIKFPHNLPQERFQSLIKSFFKKFEHDINKILIEKYGEDLRKIVIETNLENFLNLKIFLDNYNSISFIESGNFVSNLEKIGLDNKDAILVDEAYYLSLTLKNSVNFVTFDTGIQKFKKDILKAFLKRVFVSSPMEFVIMDN